MKTIHLIRKPCSEGSVGLNVLHHGGTGGLNIDGCRIPSEGGSPSVNRRKGKIPVGDYNGWNVTSRQGYNDHRAGEDIGRWPANVFLSPHSGIENKDYFKELKG